MQTLRRGALRKRLRSLGTLTPGLEVFFSSSTVVIGGLVSSTMLTLLVLPLLMNSLNVEGGTARSSRRAYGAKTFGYATVWVNRLTCRIFAAAKRTPINLVRWQHFLGTQIVPKIVRPS